MRSLRDHLIAILKRQPSPVPTPLLGREFTLLQGVVRTPDYDDAWLLACSQHAATMMDIGANVGFTALLALAFNADLEELIIVEPSPDALSHCAENLIRNHLVHRARFVCAFASNRDEDQAQLWTVEGGAAGSMYREHAITANRKNSSIRVPTITVDGLCTGYEVVPDLIKIDVEGAEHLVLEGSVACARKQQTRFLVEMHSNRELKMLDNARSLLAWCQLTGYKAWYMKTASALENPATIEHRGRCHLLLQPASWVYPEWLERLPQGAPLESVFDC